MFGIVLGLMLPAKLEAQLPSTARAPLPSTNIDNDGDYIDDNLEQALANKFAPVIFIGSDESNYPVNVDWFLQHAYLQYHEDCTFDVDAYVQYPGFPNPLMTQSNLIGVPDPWLYHANCGQGDTGYRHPPHRDITTIATDPDGQVSAGALTTGYSDQQTFVIPDLDEQYKVGSLDPRDWKTYFHAYPANDGGIMIQYWHLFAYNDLSVVGFGKHGGDWDATIHVHLLPDLKTVEGVWFSRHSHDDPGDKFAPSQMTFLGNHPLMTIDGGGHAAFASTGDFCANHSFAGGTAAWPTNMNDPLDPKVLGAIACCGNLFCDIFSSDHPGGTVWETWDGGTVVSTNNLTHQVASPSYHGGMVNLGEYNPCGNTLGGDSKCYGSMQASILEAGYFRPLNNQIFIQFEGNWGNLPHCDSVICAKPPRGPVFQGFDDNGEGKTSVYTAWYNEGSSLPAYNSYNFPWRELPSTAWTLAGPTYSTMLEPIDVLVTYVSGTTTSVLSATQNDTAVANGVFPLRTYYRAYGGLDMPPNFVLYSGPFTLMSPDGYHTIEYYTMDALNNQELTQSIALILDTTPPVVAISQPTATNYPHNGTLTLSYTVNDGQGSGVKSFTPKIDGATTISGHSMLSGQSLNLAELSLGVHTFSVDAVDNLNNASAKSVAFSITGSPVTVSASSLNFGDLLVGTSSAPQSVTLTNTGDATLNISSVVITSAAPSNDFAMKSQCGSTVGASAKCTIAVTYTPTTGGSGGGILAIQDDAPYSPQTVLLTGTGDDFSVGVVNGASTSATVSPGQSAVYNLIINPIGDFKGTVSLTCRDAPAQAGCVISPSSVALSNFSWPATATVTTAAATVVLPDSDRRPLVPQGRFLAFPLLLSWLLVAVVSLALGKRARRKELVRLSWGIALLSPVLIGVITMAACNHGGPGNNAVHNPGTPAGTYKLIVTGTFTSGSATLTHNITLTLNVK